MPDERKPRVLVVEDDAATADAVARLLRPEYDVTFAQDGRQAVGCAEQLPQPDLILTDLHMPRMSGDELAAYLSDFARTSHIPVVVLSADGSAGAVVSGHRAGARYYLTKPPGADELLETVRRALGELHRPGKGL